jgi:ABC-type transport system involved in Fe-S cluster assembly fused permease/ATPase subunit
MPPASSGPQVAPESRRLLTTLRHLWPFMWPADRPDLKSRVLLAFMALIAAKVVTVMVPFAFKWATDTLTGEGTAPTWFPALLAAPLMLVLAYNFGRVLYTSLNQVRDALFARVGLHAVRNLAYRTFVHMHRLSLRFHLERRTGGLSRVIERGTVGIETIVRHAILNSAPTLVEFALTAGIVWYQFSFWYVLVIAVTVALYLWFTIKASDWRIKIRREMNDSDTDAHSKAVDSLLNFETVKYFGNETREAGRFDQSMARYEKAAVRTWTSLAWLNFGQTLIFSTGMAICMVMSARGVIAGTQTIGDFVLINALLMQLSIPLNFIGFIYREIVQGLTDIEAMFRLLDVAPEVKDRPGAPPLVVSRGTVRFENVRFSYDPAREILKGITFDVPANATVAIVGPSGAGKSTVSRLLFRFYDVSEGRILIDGQDIRDVQQDSLRSAIGIVPQDTVLFNDTIGYNIRYGRWEAGEDEVREAARMAQVASFIEALPEGYDTPVGERGLKLSGGEKQRVAIARTILKGPPILILDEATSALDTATEQEIQSALETVSQNRTALVIAHRLSTVVNADSIIVLQDGTIAEQGTHGELIGRGGLYAAMWDRQREADEAAERLRRTREAAGAFLPPEQAQPEAAE